MKRDDSHVCRFNDPPEQCSCYDAGRKKMIELVQGFILDEILVAQREGHATSRLTSLSVKISEL